METKFKIAKFINIDNEFEKIGYEEYIITYLKGVKIHQLRIVVNGFLTKQVINLIEGNSGYKSRILLAIKEYQDNTSNNNNNNNKVTNKITLTYLDKFYSKKIVNNVKNYLLSINKEESRDKLTKYGLICVN